MAAAYSVSVVIPTYHRPRDLAQLLGSILKQTVKPIEVVIVDDTPTPVIRYVSEDYETAFDTAEIALVYGRNPKERSTSIARNVGAKISRGGIVVFLDSDLILHPDYLRKISEIFQKYPQVLGVTGWISDPQPLHRSIRYFCLQALKKLFFLFHDSTNSCEFLEYPSVLTKTISCATMSGSNMAVRRSVFDEIEFDEDLKGYAFMEDMLFSNTIYRRHPGKLLMTPDAKCVHKGSTEGRTEKWKLRYIKHRNRKYVLTRLLGLKGLMMFGWEEAGLLIIRLIGRIRKESGITDQFL